MSTDSEQPALFPDDPADDAQPMQRALTEILLTLDEVEWSTDVAAVQLVTEYARLLDASRGRRNEVATYNVLGPKLLAALTALGWTAAGRSSRGGGDDVTARTPIDELRDRRSKRPG